MGAASRGTTGRLRIRLCLAHMFPVGTGDHPSAPLLLEETNVVNVMTVLYFLEASLLPFSQIGLNW